MTGLLPLLLVTHIALALGLLVPSILLPFALRGAPAGAGSPTRAGGLVELQARWSGAIGLGLLVSGVALLAVLGFDLLGQGWLAVALVLYGVTLAIALFVQQPRLRALVGLTADADDPAWRAMSRRLRWVAYAIAGLTGVIGFLMSTKPHLW